MKYQQVQLFRQEPDMYDGVNCDLQRPRWMTSYPKEGDEEVGNVLKFRMSARSFPPGTIITIEVPICPTCGEPSDMIEPKKRSREWPDCRCGFSWSKWTSEEYS